jgi:hypothetical protein
LSYHARVVGELRVVPKVALAQQNNPQPVIMLLLDPRPNVVNRQQLLLWPEQIREHKNPFDEDAAAHGGEGRTQTFLEGRVAGALGGSHSDERPVLLQAGDREDGVVGDIPGFGPADRARARGHRPELHAEGDEPLQRGLFPVSFRLACDRGQGFVKDAAQPGQFVIVRRRGCRRRFAPIGASRAADRGQDDTCDDEEAGTKQRKWEDGKFGHGEDHQERSEPGKNPEVRASKEGGESPSARAQHGAQSKTVATGKQVVCRRSQAEATILPSRTSCLSNRAACGS